MSSEYTWNPLDEATDCEHLSALAYGNIFRLKEDEKTCVDARKIYKMLPKEGVPAHDDIAYEPSFPPKPDPHPIIPEKLEEWKQKALKKAPTKKIKEKIEFFAKNVTHVSFEMFTNSLKSCFTRLKELFPQHEPFSVTEVDSEKSDRWVEDLVLQEEWVKIPEKWTKEQKCKSNKKKVYFKSEDAMYSGSSFADSVMKIKKFPFVYVCPYVTGGIYLNSIFLEELKMATRESDFEPEVDKILFVSAESGLCTHEISSVKEKEYIDYDYDRNKSIFRWITKRWEFVEHDPKKTSITDPGEKAVVFVYFKIMESPEREAIPFYFDHKVADDYSWGNDHEESPDYSWMFAGMHEIPLTIYDNHQETTFFIEGCPNFQGNLDAREGQACPARPPWAHSLHQKRDETI